MSLTGEEILGQKPKVRKLHIADWNGEVYIRKLGGEALAELQELCEGFAAEDESKVDWKKAVFGMAGVCALTLSDENGAPLFAPGDANVIAQKVAFDALLECTQESLDLHGLTKEAGEVIRKKSRKARAGAPG
jgi:hypothetical protein